MFCLCNIFSFFSYVCFYFFLHKFLALVYKQRNLPNFLYEFMKYFKCMGFLFLFLVSIYSLPPNIFGVFLLRNITPISLLYSECHNCERKGDLESHIEEECKPLFPPTDLNKIHMETNENGTSMHYESPDGLL